MDERQMWLTYKSQKNMRKEIMGRVFSVMNRAQLVSDLLDTSDPVTLFSYIKRGIKFTAPTRVKREFLRIINEHLKQRITLTQLDLAMAKKSWVKDEPHKFPGISVVCVTKDRSVYSNCNRLYPLSVEKYNKFAKNYWQEHGSPKFGKRIITGVKFGQPETIIKHKRYPVVIQRDVGVKPICYYTKNSRRAKLQIRIQD